MKNVRSVLVVVVAASILGCDPVEVADPDGGPADGGPHVDDDAGTPPGPVDAGERPDAGTAADAGTDGGTPDASPGLLPGAPRLADLGGPVFRYQPYDVNWLPAANDAARGVQVVRFEVQESKDRTFAAVARTLRIAAPATSVTRVQPRPGFGAAATVTFHYRVRAVSAAGPGPFSGVDAKVIESSWTPDYRSVGFRGPNAPPFALDAGSFVVDDVQANNTRGTFERSGPGWLSTTDPNKGYLGHYWYVSNNAPLPRDGTEAARWTPRFAQGGRHEVWVSMFRTENRDDHAEYFVTSSNGDALGPFTVSQYLFPEFDTAWVRLGTFDFAAGTAGRVDLVWSAAGRTHSECADAVAFRRVP